MDDLEILPIVLLGVGVLMVWGGLTGENPVTRVKQVLTRGGTQTAPSSASDSTGTVATSFYLPRRDYLS